MPQGQTHTSNPTGRAGGCEQKWYPLQDGVVRYYYRGECIRCQGTDGERLFMREQVWKYSRRFPASSIYLNMMQKLQLWGYRHRVKRFLFTHVTTYHPIRDLWDTQIIPVSKTIWLVIICTYPFLNLIGTFAQWVSSVVVCSGWWCANGTSIVCSQKSSYLGMYCYIHIHRGMNAVHTT